MKTVISAAAKATKVVKFRELANTNYTKFNDSRFPEFKEFPVACVVDVNGDPTFVVGVYEALTKADGSAYAQFTKSEFNATFSKLWKLGGTLVEISLAKDALLIYTYPKMQKALLAKAAK